MNDVLTYLLLYLAIRSRGRTSVASSSLSSAKLAWPVVGLDGGRVGRVTQEYRPPEHQGVDIAVPGHYRDAVANVAAASNGRVARVSLGKRGWYVLLDHGDWSSSYLHMSSVTVQNGDMVSSGEVLGRMGADPLDANRVVHLHLQIAVDGDTVNPQQYL